MVSRPGSPFHGPSRYGILEPEAGRRGPPAFLLSPEAAGRRQSLADCTDRAAPIGPEYVVQPAGGPRGPHRTERGPTGDGQRARPPARPPEPNVPAQEDHLCPAGAGGSAPAGSRRGERRPGDERRRLPPAGPGGGAPGPRLPGLPLRLRPPSPGGGGRPAGRPAGGGGADP